MAPKAQGQVPRCRWPDADAGDIIRCGRPVVITGCPLVRSASFTFSNLANSRCFDGTERLNVHTASADGASSSFERVYAAGLNADAASDVTAMSFAEFAKAVAPEMTSAASRPSVRRYCSAPLLKGRGGVDATTTPLRDAVQCCHSGGLGDALQDAIDWDWLAQAQALLPSDSNTITFSSLQMWAGAGGGSTPLHFDGLHNYLAQVTGSKRLALFPPSETWRLYPYPVAHPKNTYAMVDAREQPAAETETEEVAGCGSAAFDAPSSSSASRFPAFRAAQSVVATLEPGDVLFLPRYWWHHVSSPEAGVENLSFSFWFAEAGGGDGAFKVALSRAIAHQPAPAVVAAAAATAAAAAAEALTAMAKPVALAAAAPAAPVDVSGDVDACSVVVFEDTHDDDALLCDSSGHGGSGGSGRDESRAAVCLLLGRYVEGVATQELGGQEGGALLQAMAAGQDIPCGPMSTQRQELASRLRGLMISLLGARGDRLNGDDGEAALDYIDYEWGSRAANALLRAIARDGRLSVRTSYFRVRGSR